MRSFRRSWAHRAFVVWVALAGCGGITGPSTSAAPTIIDIAQPWVASTASAAGMDSTLLARAVDDASAIPRVRSLLVARHGRLVMERYLGGASVASTFDVRSVTKSVVSALVGIAIANGTLTGLDAPVGGYVGAPDTLDAGDRAVTVRELLTMTSGYAWHETDGDDYNQWIVAPNHIQYLLDRPQTGPPGPFTYNSAAVHLLGIVLQDAAATPLPTLADSLLFHPVGVTSAQWEPLEQGTVNGGSGIAMTGRDLLRFGQLMLQDGRSGTAQVVPSSWVHQATTAQFPWHETLGPQGSVTFGDLWWVVDGGPPSRRAFFAWGFGGQFVYVAPSLDLVVVATTEWRGSTTDPAAAGIEGMVFGIIVSDVVPAAK